MRVNQFIQINLVISRKSSKQCEFRFDRLLQSIHSGPKPEKSFEEVKVQNSTSFH